MSQIDPARQIPVTVLTGFLGAGKTTLLNDLLKRPEMADAAVLINEFGEVGIDHHLVDKVDDQLTISLLDSGCLCCSVRGDLARALRDLFMRRLRREIPAFSRVVVETTGLADPAPVIYTLLEDFFIAERFRSDGIVAAVDVTHAENQLAQHAEAAKQVAMADRLLLTKCDLADAATVARVRARLDALNPGAPQIEIRRGDVPAGALSGCGLYDPATKAADVRRWLAEEAVRANSDHAAGTAGHAARHDARVRSFVLRFARPFVWGEFAEAIDVLLSTCGERILRVKGLVNVAGESAPRVVHCVQHVRYPEAALPAWPDDDHASRLVFIVRDFSRDYVEKAFAMFCDQAPVADA
ncbi:MAG TPA: GTP-binding protein [Azospira sp.]|nr:GTP-binding protein [Azospira sp.]